MGLALLVCDTIIEDRRTGKKTLVGLFNRVQTAALPMTCPAMSVFVSVTGARGEFPCEVVCRHSDGETTAFRVQGKVKLKDPRQVAELVFHLRGIRFTKAEMYWIHFLIDDVPLMMRPIRVSLRKPPEKPDASAPPPEEG